jgi:hypothetical protein
LSSALGVLPIRVISNTVPVWIQIRLNMDFAPVRKMSPGGNFRAAEAVGSYCRNRESFAG